jgi:hypothetical protein
MKLRDVFGPTGQPGSPRVYLSDRGTAGVQGLRIDSRSKATAEPPCPGQEDIVEVPIDLIHAASAALKEMGL